MDALHRKHGSLVPRSDGGFDVRMKGWTLAEQAEVDRESGNQTWGTAGAADAKAWGDD